MEAKQKKTLMIVLIVMVIVMVCGSVCCCGGMFMGIKSSMESSGAYTQSLEAVQQDEVVKQTLGEPIVREGMMISGNINVTPGGGSAQLNYTVKGSTGKTADVMVHATKSFDTWQFQAIDVKLDPKNPPHAVTPLLP